MPSQPIRSIAELLGSRSATTGLQEAHIIGNAGELVSLEALGIVSLSLAGTALGTTTPQGTELLTRADVTFAGGTVRRMFEAIFETSAHDTKYAREAGLAEWQRPGFDAKGFGAITDLSVAMANDIDLAELVAATGAAMTMPADPGSGSGAGAAPRLEDLVAQAGPVLGMWGQTLETTRELGAVLLAADAVNDDECLRNAREAA